MLIDLILRFLPLAIVLYLVLLPAFLAYYEGYVIAR